MTSAGYASPVLDAIAERAIAHLSASHPEGTTVADLAAAIEANPRTVRTVLKGASARYGAEPFERCGEVSWGEGYWQRRQLWRLRPGWTEAAS